jgi:hypothetical protein
VKPEKNFSGNLPISRRQLLQMSGLGFGGLALQAVLGGTVQAAGGGLGSRPAHIPPRAKSVILMLQNGGPSQMDLFDPKPLLRKFNGKQHSIKVEMFQAGSEQNKLMDTPFRFQRYGESGAELSEVIPGIGSVIDEMTLIRSMHTGHNNHTEALVMLMTGKIFQDRPALGAWISYGLGTENNSLPSYVVLRDPAGYNTSGTLTWTNGWLSALHRGTEFSSSGTPVLNLSSSIPVTSREQRNNLDFLSRLNRIHQRRLPREAELEARIQNYELAARMQLAAADVLDISGETAATRSLYGLDNKTTEPYGRRCLMARKLVEAGVRFVQVHPRPFQPWDSHSKTRSGLGSICGACDRPTAGLITDLKQRGLLDETIVIWSGEFGRLPVSQNGSGRDHNRNAFSLLAAGGGFRAGYIHGATDEVGYAAAENKVSVADLHATILHQLGIDHESLIYEHAGREETLTDPPLTGARVVDEVIS